MNRRQVLLSGGSIVALVLVPAAIVAAPAAPFVAPTTNIVHLASRIGHNYGFKEAELLQLLGADPSKMVMGSAREPEDAYVYDPYEHIRAQLDTAYSQAEAGAHDIYERARQVIGIKRKLNLHFNFYHEAERRWLDAPNPRLQGLTFRQVMRRNLRLASEVIDQALES